MKKICSLIIIALLLSGLSMADDTGKKASDKLQKASPPQLKNIVNGALNSPAKSVKTTKSEPDENSIELGIDSIKENKDGTLQINVYILNPVSIAGFQMEFIPSGLLEFESIQGGIAGDLGFMMKAGKTGRILGFSMQGTKIPVAESSRHDKNILFSLTAKFTEGSLINDTAVISKADKSREVTLDMIPIMAGEKGVKLPVYTVPFKWKLK